MPSTYKIILATVSVLVVASIPFSIATAQDDAVSYGSGTGVTSSEMFNESDIDKNGGLDREEFVEYATAQSKAGLILSGDFDNQFNSYDYNADGLLTVEEMKIPQLGTTSETKTFNSDDTHNEDAKVEE